MRRRFSGKKWFFEDGSLLGEPSTTLWGVVPIREVYSGRSRFQKIEIFDTREFGRILALDGLVQLSTRHEFVYHEMLVHPALLTLRKPGKALVIGGGDGGVLRELVKHPVEEILVLEIDEKVVELSKNHLPSLSDGAFNDPRVKFLYEDAFPILRRSRETYDVILCDSTDPHGPSRNIWSRRFYSSILDVLNPNGIAAFQTGYFKERYAGKARAAIDRIFPFTYVMRAFVGCFPFDECAFTMATKSVNARRISIATLRKRYKERNLSTRYYSPAIHLASMVMPGSLG